MEEVPVYVYSGPINPDILTRQHEHRSGLIWRWDHEICTTDLQCRHFGCNMFQITPWLGHGGCAPVPAHSGVRFGHRGERGGGFGRRRQADPSSYAPHDPLDNPGGNAPKFTLGLTPDVSSHLSGAGTSYVPHDPFDSPNDSYILPPPSVGGTSYIPPFPSVIGLSFDAPPPPS
ncbi:hypothetical protein M9H77_27152 [Catharanthus roseus]|uniref:Uncharacterized protein n=1 Tax=Catharanthus roseus TaxID=4058 RepID=A0ACC0AC46_CATRO|nr:hypothetical protein M9H77_27152 [Catharanthus roseus]